MTSCLQILDQQPQTLAQLWHDGPGCPTMMDNDTDPRGSLVTTKITLIIDNPGDPGAFEQAYAPIVKVAATLPKLRRLESAKVWPKEDGTPTPAHRTLDLYFDSYDDASAAVQTPEAGDVFGQLGATGTSFTGLFSDVEK